MIVSHEACIEFTAEEYEQFYRSYENKSDVLRLLKDNALRWSNKISNTPESFN